MCSASRLEDFHSSSPRALLHGVEERTWHDMNGEDGELHSTPGSIVEFIQMFAFVTICLSSLVSFSSSHSAQQRRMVPICFRRSYLQSNSWIEYLFLSVNIVQVSGLKQYLPPRSRFNKVWSIQFTPKTHSSSDLTRRTHAHQTSTKDGHII